jgi:cobalamin synthase
VGLGLRTWRGARVIFLPLYGAAIGAIGAYVYLASIVLKASPDSSAPPSMIPALAIFWGAIAFVPRERQRFGMTDAIIMAAGIGIRWLAIDGLALGTLATERVLIEIFIAAQTVPRAAVVAIAWASRPAGEGVGYRFSSTLTTPVALIAIAEGVAAALLCGLRPGLGILAGAYVIIRGVRWFSYRFAGGVNADSFGVTQLLLEIFVLLLFTCGACRW